jgi:Cu/Ag efflux pump CusA
MAWPQTKRRQKVRGQVHLPKGYQLEWTGAFETQQRAVKRRPVVMTALMAALGLLPAGLSTAVGAETARPFAVVIISGLVTATLLTLPLAGGAVQRAVPHAKPWRPACQ